MPPVYTPGNVNAIVNSCAGKVTVDGTIGAIPPDWQRSTQLVGNWLDNSKASGGDVFLAQNSPALIPFGQFIYAAVNAPTWWTVSLHGREIDRATLAPVPALDKSQILDFGALHTRMKAQIRYENFDGPREVTVDIGSGVRLAINASAVRITLLIPVDQQFIEIGTVVDPARDNNLTFGPGLVTDMLIGGSCLPTFAPVGDQLGTFSERITQLANTAAVLRTPIPSGAKYLTIYQDPVNNATTPWRWVQGVDFVTGASTALYSEVVPDPTVRRIDRVTIPQNVTHIQQPGGFPTNRGWQLVWELAL